MKLLLHACCGPCACYPTELLSGRGQEFDILYYNPNIHPYREFKQRLKTLREFCEKKEYNLIIDKNYDLEGCVCGMMAEKTVRCAYCYRMRMRYVAQFAKENGYDAFSTTLLVSPYQKHELIKIEAQKAAEEFGIPFYYEDFREGYQRGVDISLEMGLYRQQYCGCVFSERDRYLIRKKKNNEDGKHADEKFVVVSKHIKMVKNDY